MPGKYGALAWIAPLDPVGAPYKARLSEHSDVEVLHIDVELKPWELPEGMTGPTRADTYGWKPQVRSSNAALDRSVGEVEIAERLRIPGKSAYWTDSFGSAPAIWRPWICRVQEMPVALREIDKKIRRHRFMEAFPRGGWPDVVVWEGDGTEWNGVEYKGPSGASPKKQDRVQPSQDAFYRAGIELGLITPMNYIVARWHPHAAAVAVLLQQQLWRC